MCGRFVSVTGPDGLMRFFLLDERHGEDLPPRYNIAPSQSVYAVVEHADRRALVTFRWGLVPHWADDPKIGSRLINARAETVATKPAFRSSFARKRCLIPADGFYEWTAPSESARRLPHYVHREDQAPMAFAGLWASWRDPASPDAAPLRTCTIITAPAGPQVAGLHDRMPAMLPAETWATWLDPDCDDRELLTDVLAEASAEGVTAHRVTTAVNSPRNDHPGLVEPIEAAAES